MTNQNTLEFKEQLNQAIINADVVKIFDYLLTIAVEEEASDIHIEPFENYCRMRIRIDGILSELVQYPTNLHESIISKFKIESGQMRPDEKRLPQDARVSTMTKTNKEIDLRASTIPTIWGEKLVMRIVDKSKEMPLLQTLGLQGINRDLIYKKITEPNGIILTTGPTGSGKTSTLYAALAKINKIEVNITTFEDPVENKILGLNQSQIRADINFTFANGLRSALRQDPDIIMVWEIRDHETLEMAMEAAMTGHLVFSTVHTNSAAETITRLLNLGAHAYMLAGTVNLLMAQRLARRVCPTCKVQKSVKGTEFHRNAVSAFRGMNVERLKEELQKRNISIERWKQFIEEGIISYGTWVYWEKKPEEKPTETPKETNRETTASSNAAEAIAGLESLDSLDDTSTASSQSEVIDTHNHKPGAVCQTCGGWGYKHRIGFFEVMELTDDIKTMLIQDKTAYEIEKYALSKGMINLERDAIFKVVQDITTLEEAYRVVKHKVIE